MGCRLLRALATEAGSLRIRALETAHADPSDGIREGDSKALPDERRAGARDGAHSRARLLFDPIACLRQCDHQGCDNDGSDKRGNDGGSSPDDNGSDEHTDGEGNETRLREGEEQADPHRSHDSVEAREPPPAHAAKQDPSERGENADRQVTPVDRGVPEDRVDPEERRIGVPDDHLGVPEHIAGDPLVGADRREGERRADECDPKPRDVAASPRKPRKGESEESERQDEGSDVDRSLSEVDGPRKRQARPGDERCERNRNRPEFAGAVLARDDELPTERDRKRGHDDVEREQEVRVVAAQPDRNPCRHTGKRCERK